MYTSKHWIWIVILQSSPRRIHSPPSRHILGWIRRELKPVKDVIRNTSCPSWTVEQGSSQQVVTEQLNTEGGKMPLLHNIYLLAGITWQLGKFPSSMCPIWTDNRTHRWHEVVGHRGAALYHPSACVDFLKYKVVGSAAQT